jgi:hypothetical protein
MRRPARWVAWVVNHSTAASSYPSSDLRPPCRRQRARAGKVGDALAGAHVRAKPVML